MIEAIVETLRCPHCCGPLSRVSRSGGAGGADVLGCADGHVFDVARQGYVNLLPGDAHAGTADTPAMVAAREEFLGRGHLSRVADAVAAAGREGADGASGLVVEVGAGTGYYLAHALDAMPERAGLALDISKHAARRAARAHPRMGAVVCDVWRAFPVASACAALVLDVFAPRNAAEMARVLAPGGALVVVTPTGGHLCELVEERGLLRVDGGKEQRLAASLGEHFEQESERTLTYTVALTPADREAAVAMGPSAYHSARIAPSAAGADAGIAADVTVSVRIGVYRPRR